MDLILSTSSILGCISNVSHKENISSTLQPDFPIIKIESNFTIPHKKCFNSQVTILIELIGNRYNIKLFRNGKFLITGYMSESNDQLIELIGHLIHYINKNPSYFHINGEIKLMGYERILENYKFTYTEHPINLILLNKRILLYKRNSSHNIDFYVISCKYDISKGGKILVKLRLINKYDITTIKIFHSGKINIDGKHTRELATKYQSWIIEMISTY